MRRGFTNNGTASNHGNFVCDGSNFAKLVSDEDNRGPSFGKLTHDRHEFVSLLRREHCRWLIKNEDLRLTRKRFNDFNSLLGTDGKIFNERIGIKIETKAR